MQYLQLIETVKTVLLSKPKYPLASLLVKIIQESKPIRVMLQGLTASGPNADSFAMEKIKVNITEVNSVILTEKQYWNQRHCTNCLNFRYVACRQEFQEEGPERLLPQNI